MGISGRCKADVGIFSGHQLIVPVGHMRFLKSGRL